MGHSLSKEKRDMGFRNLHLFNLFMLGKYGWNFISIPHTLASRSKLRFSAWEFIISSIGFKPELRLKEYMVGSICTFTRLEMVYWRWKLYQYLTRSLGKG